MTRYPKDNWLYLQHILQEIAKMDSFIADGARDEKTYYAVVRCFEIIGEASTHITKEFKHQHPSLPWQQMKGMRNTLAHDYLGINPKSLWETVADDIPALREEINKLLQLRN